MEPSNIGTALSYLTMLPKFLCTINNEIIFKNSTTDFKLAIFIHIKIHKN